MELDCFREVAFYYTGAGKIIILHIQNYPSFPSTKWDFMSLCNCCICKGLTLNLYKTNTLNVVGIETTAFYLSFQTEI